MAAILSLVSFIFANGESRRQLSSVTDWPDINGRWKWRADTRTAHYQPFLWETAGAWCSLRGGKVFHCCSGWRAANAGIGRGPAGSPRRPLRQGTAPLTVTMDQPAKTPKTAEREQHHSWPAGKQLRAVTLRPAPKFAAAAAQRV